jgi:hypothetical protein
MRPLFEPTDLEMEPTGMLDVDLQVGGIRGRGPWRVVVTDSSDLLCQLSRPSAS